MFCKNCGKQQPDGSKFCTGCGASLEQKAGHEQPIQQQYQQPIQQQPIQQQNQYQQTPPIQAYASSSNTQSNPNFSTTKENAPRNTGELLKYIIKKIPERVLKALPLTIIIGLVSWLVHTYLLVYTNQGFNPDTWLGKNFLNL